MKQQKQPWILFWLPWTETQKKLKEHGVFFNNTTFTCINHNIKKTRGSKEKNKTFVFSQGLCLLFLFVPVCFPWRNKKSLFCFVLFVMTNHEQPTADRRKVLSVFGKRQLSVLEAFGLQTALVLQCSIFSFNDFSFRSSSAFRLFYGTPASWVEVPYISQK